MNSRAMKKRLLKTRRFACAYCGKGFQNLNQITLDHIQPKSEGGSSRKANLNLACRACNEAKGSMSVEEFIALRNQQRVG